ncbi:hypothetical protein FA15DRAFT_670825 [Coprinopsis marcescibilis]|uniref:Uncharacterized protein n=1 Tax=Coprinopsis marcescibilis TaxID=230819 RepID=A0A5C3KRN3_COPMA|nr:hypothetical protein FA15DRAFT_670825 [Coprinopsis marcescibilis]
MPVPYHGDTTMESIQQKKQTYSRQLAAYTRQQRNSVTQSATDPTHRAENNNGRRQVSTRTNQQRNSPQKREEQEQSAVNTPRGIAVKDFANQNARK